MMANQVLLCNHIVHNDIECVCASVVRKEVSVLVILTKTVYGNIECSKTKLSNVDIIPTLAQVVDAS